jgi:hypothetical protein
MYPRRLCPQLLLLLPLQRFDAAHRFCRPCDFSQGAYRPAVAATDVVALLPMAPKRELTAQEAMQLGEEIARAGGYVHEVARKRALDEAVGSLYVFAPRRRVLAG